MHLARRSVCDRPRSGAQSRNLQSTRSAHGGQINRFAHTYCRHFLRVHRLAKR